MQIQGRKTIVDAPPATIEQLARTSGVSMEHVRRLYRLLDRAEAERRAKRNRRVKRTAKHAARKPAIRT
jgi:hypothetical protein